MYIFGYTNNATGHLSLELIFADDVGGMWSSESHRNSKALDTAASDICIHLARWLCNRCRQKVLNDYRPYLLFFQFTKELCEVSTISNVVRTLHYDTTELGCFIPWEVIGVAEDELDPDGACSGLHHVDCLWIDAIRHEHFWSFPVVSRERHGTGFSSCTCFIEKRRIRNIQTGQFGDHCLVVEEHFKSALRYLSLIRCVRRVPLRVLKDVPLYDCWCDCWKVSLALITLIDLVFVSKFSHFS